MIYLDSSAIDTWLLCREAYRQRYVVNRVPSEPSIHLAFGHAVHVAVEQLDIPVIAAWLRAHSAVR